MMKIMMKYNFIKEIVTDASNDSQHQNNAHPKHSPIDCDGGCWPILNVTWYPYPYHDTENTKLNYTIEMYTWNQTGNNNKIITFNAPA